MPLTPEDIELVREIQESSRNITIKHNKDGSITLPDSLLLLSDTVVGLLVLAAAIANLVRLAKTPLSNVMSPIRLSQIGQNRIIEGILYELMGVTQGDRCSIGLFENGISTGSLHWSKLRISHEVVSPSTTKRGRRLQEISEALETEILESSHSEFRSISRHNSELQEDCQIYMDSSGFSFMISRLFKGETLFGRDIVYDAILNIDYVEVPTSNPLDNPETVKEMKVIFNRLKRAIAYIKKGKKLPENFR